MVVSDLAGGSPPAPDSLPGAPTLHDEPHPAGIAGLGAHSRPASPPLAQQQEQLLCGTQQHPHIPMDSGEAMQVDRALLSRSQSPALSGGMAALRVPPPSDQQASAFVPVSEVGGSGASSHVHEAAVEQQHPEEQHPQPPQHLPHPHHAGRPPLDPHLPLPPREARMHEPQQAAQPSAHEQQPQPSGSSLGEPSSRPERLPSGAGYESGDDMDMLAVQHCTNCTGTLWGHICMVSVGRKYLPVLWVGVRACCCSLQPHWRGAAYMPVASARQPSSIIQQLITLHVFTLLAAGLRPHARARRRHFPAHGGFGQHAAPPASAGAHDFAACPDAWAVLLTSASPRCMCCKPIFYSAHDTLAAG